MNPSRPRRRLVHFALVWLVACAASSIAGIGRGVTATGPDPARSGPSLRDSPGWYPIVDPESTAVVLDRRPNAPLVRAPFHGGGRSLEELGRAICRGLHHSDRDSLLALCVRDDEFRDVLWREFPQSRPITGLGWEDGWIALDQRLRSGISGAVGDYAGDDWTFVRFEIDSIATFRNFRLHRVTRMVAIDDHGATVRMPWVRAIAERKGRFKIYSTDD